MYNDSDSSHHVQWFRLESPCTMIQTRVTMYNDSDSSHHVQWFRLESPCTMIQTRVTMYNDSDSSHHVQWFGLDTLRVGSRTWCLWLETRRQKWLVISLIPANGYQILKKISLKNSTKFLIMCDYAINGYPLHLKIVKTLVISIQCLMFLLRCYCVKDLACDLTFVSQTRTQPAWPRTQDQSQGLRNWNTRLGSFHQVGARFVTVSIVTSVNVPSIILD